MTNRLILGAVILGMSTLPHTQLYAAVESAVADAAMHSDYDTVRSLLREGADVGAHTEPKHDVVHQEREEDRAGNC